MRTPPNERVASDIVDAPKARTKSEPERRCILSGETQPRAALLRLAISPDGDVLPDPNAKAPGRGAWIGVNQSVLELALSKGQLKGALARAFKGAALNIPADLTVRIASALSRNLTDRLGLEMRSGHVVLGSQRIAEQARQGRIALLLHASDSSADGRKKLDQAWRVGCDQEGTGARGNVLPLDRDALSVALGRENVVHLGIGEAAAALRVEQALARLLNYLGSEGPTEIDGISHGCDDAGRHELNA